MAPREHWKNENKFLFRLSFALIGWFSPVYIHGRLSEEFSESQAAIGMTFRVAGNYRKAGKAPWILDTGRIFTISKYFIEVSRNFILDFLHKKTAKNGENHQRAFKGSEFAGIRPCNFISSAHSSRFNFLDLQLTFDIMTLRYPFKCALMILFYALLWILLKLTTSTNHQLIITKDSKYCSKNLKIGLEELPKLCQVWILNSKDRMGITKRKRKYIG